MTADELLKQIEGEMTGDPQADIHYIHTLSDTLKKEENAEVFALYKQMTIKLKEQFLSD